MCEQAKPGLLRLNTVQTPPHLDYWTPSVGSSPAPLMGEEASELTTRLGAYSAAIPALAGPEQQDPDQMNLNASSVGSHGDSLPISNPPSFTPDLGGSVPQFATVQDIEPSAPMRAKDPGRVDSADDLDDIIERLATLVVGPEAILDCYDAQDIVSDIESLIFSSCNGHLRSRREAKAKVKAYGMAASYRDACSSAVLDLRRMVGAFLSAPKVSVNMEGDSSLKPHRGP